MIAALIKYRWLLLSGGVVAFIAGAWVHGYQEGKAHVRASIAEKQIVLITEAQKDREAIDDKVRKMDDTAIDDALAFHGWLRPVGEL